MNLEELHELFNGGDYISTKVDINDEDLYLLLIDDRLYCFTDDKILEPRLARVVNYRHIVGYLVTVKLSINTHYFLMSIDVEKNKIFWIHEIINPDRVWYGKNFCVFVAKSSAGNTFHVASYTMKRIRDSEIEALDDLDIIINDIISLFIILYPDNLDAHGDLFISVTVNSPGFKKPYLNVWDSTRKWYRGISSYGRILTVKDEGEGYVVHIIGLKGDYSIGKYIYFDFLPPADQVYTDADGKFWFLNTDPDTGKQGLCQIDEETGLPTY